MTKRDIASVIHDKLEDEQYTMTGAARNYVLHVSDDEGNTEDFKMRLRANDLKLSTEAILKVITLFTEVVNEAIARGEDVFVPDIGKWKIRFAQPRSYIDYVTGDTLMTEGKYVPKFTASSALKRSAECYGEMAKNRNRRFEEYDINTDYEEDDDDDEVIDDGN